MIYVVAVRSTWMVCCECGCRGRHASGLLMLPLAALMGGRASLGLGLVWSPASRTQLWKVKQQKAVGSIAAWWAARLLIPSTLPQHYVATSYSWCPSLISPPPDRPSPSTAPPPPWQLLLTRLVRPVACWREGRWTLDGHLPSIAWGCLPWTRGAHGR